MAQRINTTATITTAGAGLVEMTTVEGAKMVWIASRKAFLAGLPLAGQTVKVAASVTDVGSDGTLYVNRVIFS